MATPQVARRLNRHRTPTKLEPRSGMPRPSLKKTLLIAVVIALPALFVLLVPLPYEASALVENEYVIDEPFSRVRKIMVRTNAVKEVVGMSKSEFVDQQWDTLNLDVGQLLRNSQWEISGQGRLKVLTKDPYVGEHLITLLQDVEVKEEQIHVVTSLETPTDRLRDYRAESSFGTALPELAAAAAAAPETTLVRSSLLLTIATSTPLVWRSVALKRVHEAAEESLAAQEAAIRRVVDQNRNSLLILP